MSEADSNQYGGGDRREGIGAYAVILERIELLAQRWVDESRRHKELYDQYKANGTAHSSFLRTCWQRYVDYERRATELRNTVKYLPTIDEWERDKKEEAAIDSAEIPPPADDAAERWRERFAF